MPTKLYLEPTKNKKARPNWQDADLKEKSIASKHGAVLENPWTKEWSLSVQCKV